MKSFLATFYTHYGAIKFKNDCDDLSIKAKLMPVPRALSSSCGICVAFDWNSCEFVAKAQHEDMEKCFLVVGNESYKQLLEF